MPVIKSAIKKLRQDKKREKTNDKLRQELKSTLRSAKKTKNGKSVAKAISIVDKAAKHKIIHKNKAARLKSSITKLSKPVGSKSAGISVIKSTKKASLKKKSSVKKASK